MSISLQAREILHLTVLEFSLGNNLCFTILAMGVSYKYMYLENNLFKTHKIIDYEQVDFTVFMFSKYRDGIENKIHSSNASFMHLILKFKKNHSKLTGPI